MEHDRRISKSKLFRIMMKIGCIGFGGGNALIPVMQKEMVDESKAVTAEEFDEDVVVASITPGALPVEIAGGIGNRLYGWKGMLLGAIGMAFPGVFLTIIFLSCLSEIDQNITRQIHFLTVGISAYIVCLLIEYVISSLHQAKNATKMAQVGLVIGIVFFLTCGKTLYRLLEISAPPIFSLSTIHVFAVTFFLIFCLHEKRSFWWQTIAITLSIAYILCVGNGVLHIPLMLQITEVLMLLLAVNGLWHSFSYSNTWQLFSITESKRAVLVLVVFLLAFSLPALLVSSDTLIYVSSGVLSSLMSFGGGDAYLTVADGLFVETDLITEDDFYGTIVPLVNLMPGSILCKTLTGIGYFIGQYDTCSKWGAYLMAMAGFAASLFASCGVFAVVMCIYREFQQLEIFKTVRQVIRPVVSGLLLTVALTLFYQARKLGVVEGIGSESAGLMLVLSAMSGWLYFVRKLENVKVLLVSCLVALIVCNFMYLNL